MTYTERQRARARQWYQDHKEESKARAKKWREAHVERCREYNRRYREIRAEQRIEKEKIKSGAITKDVVIDNRVKRAVRLFKNEDAARNAAWLIEHRYQAKL